MWRRAAPVRGARGGHGDRETGGRDRSEVHLCTITAEAAATQGSDGGYSTGPVPEYCALGGEIQTDQIAGAAAGTINNKLSAVTHLSAEGTLVTGIRRVTGVTDTSLGGFAGSPDGGQWENRFAYVEVEGRAAGLPAGLWARSTAAHIKTVTIWRGVTGTVTRADFRTYRRTERCGPVTRRG